jgi:hypothetical protein
MWPIRSRRTFCQRDFDAAFLADDAFVLHPLVLAAQALVVLHWTEDARAEQAVTLGLERPVVDRFRLLDLTERPRRISLGLAIEILISSKVLRLPEGCKCLFILSSCTVYSYSRGEKKSRGSTSGRRLNR